MCFPLIAGDSPVARSWPDKAVLKYRQSWVSKQSERERECCSGNSSGMGRDLAAALQLENLTGAASEHRLGLLTPGGPQAAPVRASQHTLGLSASLISCPGKRSTEVGAVAVLRFPASLAFPGLLLVSSAEFSGGGGVCEQVGTSSCTHLVWSCNLSPTPFKI